MTSLLQVTKALLARTGIAVMHVTTWRDMRRAIVLRELVQNQPIDLLRILTERLAGSNHTIVQVGANDGCSDDPVHSLILEHGWQGVLVEPQPGAFARLQETYAGCRAIHLVNCAVSTSIEPLVLYKFVPPSDGDERCDLLTTSSREQLERARIKFGIDYPVEQIIVPTETLDGILKKHAISKVDVLIIDTEGMDSEVLQTISLSRFQPHVVQFEHVHLSDSQLRDVTTKLVSNGYKLACVNKDIVACK